MRLKSPRLIWGESNPSSAGDNIFILYSKVQYFFQQCQKAATLEFKYWVEWLWGIYHFSLLTEKRHWVWGRSWSPFESPPRMATFLGEKKVSQGGKHQNGCNKNTPVLDNFQPCLLSSLHFCKEITSFCCLTLNEHMA